MTHKLMPDIDPARCSGCGVCVARCPTGALAVQDKLAQLARPDLCSYCADCEDVCPYGAIALPFLVVFSPDQSMQ